MRHFSDKKIHVVKNLGNAIGRTLQDQCLCFSNLFIECLPILNTFNHFRTMLN